MPERLPHLTTLRTFETVGRRLSFKDAADELGISASAVSHQIRTLEAYLDVRLFRRLTRSVELTEAGAALLPKLDMGFRLIETAVREVRSVRGAASLVVATGPALAGKWLMPRLYRFQERHPDIDLRVTISHKPVDLERDGADVALRHGPGGYPDLEVVRLFGEAYAPMCSPHWLRTARPPLRTPAALAHHRLLHDDSASMAGATVGWAEWLRAAKVESVEAQSGTHFQQADHALQAAIDGSGVLLGRMALASLDLAAKRLVLPFDLVLPSRFAYWFLTRMGRLRERPIAALLLWLQDEARLPPQLPA